jgi:hypothetical protein
VKTTFKLFLLLIFPVLLLFNSSCKKDNLGLETLTFSTDTLTFDTVFTTLGSTTRFFKVFNNSSKPIEIADIRLMGLVGNQFRMNVDGIPGTVFTNVEVPARDSIYVFVEVTVDPNSQNTPYVIIDDVQFVLNGELKTVHLQAFGQNAYFHYGENITTSTTWQNDKPHVVVSKDTVPGVFVRCGATLNISPGTKIFFASGAAMFIEGTLNANASTWSDSIVFQGVRLEQFYDDKPGQWFGLVFLRSAGCLSQGFFNHCVINESTNGVYAGAGLSSDINTYLGASNRPDVVINNTIIKNSQLHAIQAFNAKVLAENSLFIAAGDNMLKLWLGGDYTFNHCTAYNTGSRFLSHKKETLLLNNAVVSAGVTYLEPIKSVFTNSIIYGNLQNEIAFANSEGLNLTNFDHSFNYSILKTREDTLTLFSTSTNQLLFNQDPRLKNPDKGDYAPSDSIGYFSPAIDFAPTGLGSDIYDRPRPVSKTTNTTKFDAGAIETP